MALLCGYGRRLTTLSGDFWRPGQFASHECEVEGATVCPDTAVGAGCVYENTVRVTDGYFTIGGYSHDTGTCHGVSMVKLASGAPPPPPEHLEFYCLGRVWGG